MGSARMYVHEYMRVREVWERERDRAHACLRMFHAIAPTYLARTLPRFLRPPGTLERRCVQIRWPFLPALRETSALDKEQAESVPSRPRENASAKLSSSMALSSHRRGRGASCLAQRIARRSLARFLLTLTVD
eukprot:2880364-Pleurochrysis_carterae.AAC.2